MVRIAYIKEVEIIEATVCKDHIHMLASIPPKISVSSFVGYLKGQSSLMIFERYANLKYRYGNRKFWCTGYYVDIVGRNKKVTVSIGIQFNLLLILENQSSSKTLR